LAETLIGLDEDEASARIGQAAAGPNRRSDDQQYPLRRTAAFQSHHLKNRGGDGNEGRGVLLTRSDLPIGNCSSAVAS